MGYPFPRLFGHVCGFCGCWSRSSVADGVCAIWCAVAFVGARLHSAFIGVRLHSALVGARGCLCVPGQGFTHSATVVTYETFHRGFGAIEFQGNRLFQVQYCFCCILLFRGGSERCVVWGVVGTVPTQGAQPDSSKCAPARVNTMWLGSPQAAQPRLTTLLLVFPHVFHYFTRHSCFARSIPAKQMPTSTGGWGQPGACKYGGGMWAHRGPAAPTNFVYTNHNFAKVGPRLPQLFLGFFLLFQFFLILGHVSFHHVCSCVFDCCLR